MMMKMRTSDERSHAVLYFGGNGQQRSHHHKASDAVGEHNISRCPPQQRRPQKSSSRDSCYSTTSCSGSYSSTVSADSSSSEEPRSATAAYVSWTIVDSRTSDQLISTISLDITNDSPSTESETSKPSQISEEMSERLVVTEFSSYSEFCGRSRWNSTDSDASSQSSDSGYSEHSLEQSKLSPFVKHILSSEFVEVGYIFSHFDPPLTFRNFMISILIVKFMATVFLLGFWVYWYLFWNM